MKQTPNITIINEYYFKVSKDKYQEVLVFYSPRPIREPLQERRRDHRGYLSFSLRDVSLEYNEYPARDKAPTGKFNIIMAGVNELEISCMFSTGMKLVLLSKSREYKGEGDNEESFKFLNIAVFLDKKDPKLETVAKVFVFGSDLGVFFKGDAWLFLEEFIGYLKQKRSSLPTGKPKVKTNKEAPVTLNSH